MMILADQRVKCVEQCYKKGTIEGLMLIPLAIAALFITQDTTREVFTAPDGVEEYICSELQESSAAGCYTHWTRTIYINGKAWPWTPAICRESSCNQGGVPWWWWNEGKLGEPVLKDFWIRDYKGPKNNNPYGDAKRIPGESNCYSVQERIICMQRMEQSTARPLQDLEYLTRN
jgi:hypothetical protein